MTERHRSLIALGTNIEPRKERMLAAIKALESLGSVEAVSSVYETAPVGYTDQPDFLNAAALVLTKHSALDLWQGLRAIELQLGRQTRSRWHEREIDLDLLFFDEQVIASEVLTIPHPELHRRKFVLEPLAEIAPNFVHPVIGRTVAELLASLESSS